MATFTFDGTSSITATKDDTVFITANPQNFTQATDNGSNVSLAFGGSTLTITGTTLVADGLPNVFVSGGEFAYSGGTPNDNTPATTGNVLSFLVNGSYAAPTDGTANSKIAIFGGLGRVDSIDGADSITIGGKGSILVYGNAGADSIEQTVAFDSTSIVNVNGDTGADSITLVQANTKASIFVGGGAGEDQISVVNSGTTTIFGGIDSTDGGDNINFSGVNGAGGKSLIYGNGGNDNIYVDGGNGNDGYLDSTSATTVYGGFGDDEITAYGDKATISVLGNEGKDDIYVENNGNSYITGGNQSGDQSLDDADYIHFDGIGNALIYGNAGDDEMDVHVYDYQGSVAEADVTANVSAYGGKGDDYIDAYLEAGSKATLFVAGGEGSDTIEAYNYDGGSITVYGGVSASDSADAADSIYYGGSGTANIFGNGGADSIQIDTLGAADSTNATVTVQGGGGADSITVSGQANGQQALVLTGNEGNDTFSIEKGTGQTITVTDFATSADKLSLTNLGGTPGNLQITTGSFQTLQQALDAASTASGGTSGQSKAAAVVFGGSTYVVIEQGDAGFAAGTDQAIKLTGVTDLVGLVGATTVSSTTPSA